MNWEQNFPAAKVVQATIHPRLLQKTLTLCYSIAMQVKKSFLVSLQGLEGAAAPATQNSSYKDSQL